jgi:hypothetical protein
MISASVERPLPSLKTETRTFAMDAAPSELGDCTASGSAAALSPHIGRHVGDAGAAPGAPGALSDRRLLDTRAGNRARRSMRGEHKSEAPACAVR